MFLSIQGIFRCIANILQLIIDCHDVIEGIIAYEMTQSTLQLVCNVPDEGLIYSSDGRNVVEDNRIHSCLAVVSLCVLFVIVDVILNMFGRTLCLFALYNSYDFNQNESIINGSSLNVLHMFGLPNLAHIHNVFF